jgi:hypothetical protein
MPKTISVSKPARTARDLARNVAILISEFLIPDLTLRGGRMLQEKLKFGTQPTFDRTEPGQRFSDCASFWKSKAPESRPRMIAILKAKAK